MTRLIPDAYPLALLKVAPEKPVNRDNPVNLA
jgi:hypothetical protein